MRNLAVVTFFLLLINTINAQVGINTTSVDASLALDIKSSDKGVLLPKYDLIDINSSTSPIANPTNGLMIYNIGPTSTYPKGIYFWNGTRWDKLITNYESDAIFSLGIPGTTNPTIVSSTKTSPTGWQINANTIEDATSDGTIFSLPAGKYKVDVKLDARYNSSSSTGVLTAGGVKYNILSLKCGIIDSSANTFLTDTKYGTTLVAGGTSILGLSYSFWLDLPAAKTMKLHISYATGNTNQLSDSEVQANQNGLMMNITRFL